MIALRDLIHDDDADLSAWLQTRRPANGLALLRDVLDGAAPAPAPIELEPEVVVAQEPDDPSFSNLAIWAASTSSR